MAAYYHLMYQALFNAITDAESRLCQAEHQLSQTRELLRRVQQDCEEIYIETCDPPPSEPNEDLKSNLHVITGAQCSP